MPLLGATGKGRRGAALFLVGMIGLLHLGAQPAAAAPGDYAWVSFGGVITSRPDFGLVSGELGAVARGSDGAVWLNRGTTTRSWSSLGGQIVGAPAMSSLLVDPPDSLSSRTDLFARGIDNALWTRTYNTITGQWSGWQNLGGVLTSEPSAMAFDTTSDDAAPDFAILVFGRGMDNALWYREFRPASGWSSWTSLGGVLTSAPGAGGEPGAFEGVVAVRGNDNAAWYRQYSGDGESGTFGPWLSTGGILTAAPAAEWSCSPVIYARGTDNALWQIEAGSGQWVSYGGISRSGPGSFDAGGALSPWTLGVQGADDALWVILDEPPGVECSS